MALATPWNGTPSIPGQIPSFSDFVAQKKAVGTAFAPPVADMASQWSYAPAPASMMSFDPAAPGTTSKPSIAASPAATTPSASGANPYGYAYASPGAGFNPWGMYDGRNGYDGTASDGVGLYQAAKDSAKGWGPNGTPETDRDRVMRMALDQAKAESWDPGAAQNQQRFQAAVLSNIARLHRDYINTPGLGQQAWANSAFAGYDKLLQGGAGAANPAAAQPGAPPAPSSAAPAAGTPPPVAGVGGLGGSGGVPGGGGNLAETQRQYLLDDPEYALRYMLQQRGIDVNQKGLVGAYMRSKYLDPLKAAISATGLGTGGSAVGDIEGVLSQFGAGLQSKGNDLENFLHGMAQNAQNNPALGDMSDQDLMTLEQNLGALGTFGTNDYVASAKVNQFNDLKQGFGDLFFGGLAGGQMPTFQQFMQQRNYRPY